MDWGNFISGLVGAAIGGAATLVGAKWQLSEAEAGQKKREDKHHAAILRAIHDELETLWDHYLKTVGNQIAALPKDKPFNAYWPVSNDYFVVFNSNAVFLGHIEDSDLRKSLIVAYSAAKGLVDSFRLNNAMVEKLELAHQAAALNPNDVTNRIAAVHLQTLTNYGAKLREGHAQVDAAVADALRRLRKSRSPNRTCQNPLTIDAEELD